MEEHLLRSGEPYPPISDYGFIADCSCTALVSRDGSVDWCCIPRVDSPSCFGRLLGWQTGGFFRIAPLAPYRVRRSYLQHTLILETVFTTESGSVRLLDLFPVGGGRVMQSYQQLLRIVEGVEGEVPVRVTIVPRFDYGGIQPWIKRYRKESFIALGGCNGLLLSGDLPLEQVDRHALGATVTLSSGERRRVSILHRPPELLDGDAVDPPDVAEMEWRFEESVRWWRGWCQSEKTTTAAPDLVLRSALVLKGLSNCATGAIAAAATTSLPEAPGGPRNWDYRYSWIRDSVFTVRALTEIGYHEESDAFRRFIERSTAGSVDELQIMFGVGGERHLEEYRVATLEGYDGAAPVRVGNVASRQLQLDVYGELLDHAWRWHQLGASPDDDYWDFLTHLVGAVARNWRRKDHGIWEMRGQARHFVFSKVMCWAAVDRAVSLARELGREAPLEEWSALARDIGESVENEGYDRERGIFVQYFGGRELDASLLLMPMTGFLAWDDPRMVRTVDAIQEELSEGGLLRRYAAGSDGLEGREGVFIACSFWLTECLARQGRWQEAREAFARAVATGNDLGLFPEEYDTGTGRMLGNFPQALTHLSLIGAALALEGKEGGQ
ncbi:glycoside hydrolase family 15 protein [Geomonas sp. RF6]|uniref:glycoside hydrolase family 15 protein n=1 Tax=Geomonas sp. RF6 TaxID=2897342 RepID=UPI001E5539D8|nr:glycoside hydrolase family 15 protein [Geomonas sp. RF6]UFS69184.1 glycoside hydrolase family 15 protein [Geomonas sp. RF6]